SASLGRGLDSPRSDHSRVQHARPQLDSPWESAAHALGHGPLRAPQNAAHRAKGAHAVHTKHVFACRRGDTNPKYTRSLGSMAHRCMTAIVRRTTPGTTPVRNVSPRAVVRAV